MTEDELGHWILAQIKKRETTKQKLQSAEIFIIALCEVIKSIMSIVRETTKKINKAKDLVARLDTVIPLIEQRMSHLTREANHAAKFKGKKISKENQGLYEEIESVHLELTQEFGETPYRFACNKVAKIHKKNQKSLYSSFMKWKNSRYAKSS